jgi:hypothetical protein
MKCERCKYFAVPLDESEKDAHHCPGAYPLGDPSKKICVLRGREGFDDKKLDPENCSYFFSVALRFR